MPCPLRVRSGQLRERAQLRNRRPGIDEIVAAVGDARSVLDVGCGSGRLTVALAAGGRDVTGVDTNARQLAAAKQRADAAGVRVRWMNADMNGPLPFADGAFAAAVSRLSLMIAEDPPATLAETARSVERGGVLVSAVWAAVDENPWFTAPRAAVREALGADRAAFARHFGRLGTADDLAGVYRRAGLGEPDVHRLVDDVVAASVADHWDFLTQTIGHYKRLAAALTPDEADRLERALAEALEPYRQGDGVRLPRTMLMAVARR